MRLRSRRRNVAGVPSSVTVRVPDRLRGPANLATFATSYVVRGPAAAMGGLVLSGCDTQATGPEFAVVEKVTPIKVSTSTPKQVCEDRAVTTRLPERDGNTGGTVAGAVIGGLLGNQVGKGDGKKAATLAGAIAGGVAGHEIDKRHEGGREVTEIQQDCRTVQQTQSRIDGYTVEYLYKGQRHQVRMAEAPKDGRVEVRSDGSLIDS